MKDISMDDVFEAFKDMPDNPPDKINMGDSIESLCVGNYFRNKSWLELNVIKLRESYPGDESACLSFMTPEAFRYFFPAYMRMALIEYDKADAIFDTVLSKLNIAAKDENSELRQIFLRYQIFQLEAIAKYLVLLSESICHLYPVNLATIALEEYWGQYLKK